MVLSAGIVWFPPKVLRLLRTFSPRLSSRAERGLHAGSSIFCISLGARMVGRESPCPRIIWLFPGGKMIWMCSRVDSALGLRKARVV